MSVDLTPETTVRHVLTNYPQTFTVFERHGMCADCRVQPPPLPLHHFAGKHCGGDVAGLIRELEAAIGDAMADA